MYTAQDEVILDPFMGAGATALAARKAGRKFVGYEIEQKYCDIANRRLIHLTEKQGVLALIPEDV